MDSKVANFDTSYLDQDNQIDELCYGRYGSIHGSREGHAGMTLLRGRECMRSDVVNHGKHSEQTQSGKNVRFDECWYEHPELNDSSLD